MKKLLCPSMMCADFGELKKEVDTLDKSGIDIFHVDIMDGSFVPNFGMGLQDFELIRKSTHKNVDVHLMIKDPVKYVEMFADLGADIIYFHPEADTHPIRTLDKIHNKRKKAGIAINPGTSVETVKELFPLVDYILVMTVNPGFAGQNYINHIDKKIETLINMQDNYKYEIIVDGAISHEKVLMLGKLGVKGFILGTSALFGKEKTYEEIILDLRKMK